MLTSAELEGCCEKLGVTVAEAKKGNQKLLLNVLKRYLASEELEAMTDQGLGVYKVLHEHIKGLLDDQVDRTTETLASVI